MKKSRWLEIKTIAAEGQFEGVLSPYGNVDGGRDVVEPGAFTKTLKEQGLTRVLLWQHKVDTPIGELTLEDRQDGLWAKGQLLMDLPEAQKAYLLIKTRIIKGLSIGFESIKDSIEGGIRHLKEVKLYEGSIVTFPMNEMALITAVKGKRGDHHGTKGDFNEELTEIQTLDGLYQMEHALWSALYSILWVEATRDEKVAAAETILTQFQQAFSNFFPSYLDAMEAAYGGMETWNRKEIEKKAGATFSAANIQKISTALGKIKGGHDDLTALISEEAGESTSEEKAANRPDPPQGHPGEAKPEPEQDHSAAKTLMEEIGALIPA